MADRQGFTLLEIIVVMIIVATTAAVVLPSLNTAMEQTRAQAAKNNLFAISAAQSKYNEDHGIYCTTGCANTNAALNSNLIAAVDLFSYTCSDTAEAIPYNCAASDGTDTLTLDPNANVTCSGPSGDCPS